MNILAIADVPSKSLWDFYEDGKLAGIDLILSAGDLPAQYLSFLVTFASCPLLYVHGNHDDGYLQKPPEGCECIDDRIYTYQGIRILGLGGSMRYKSGKNQYTEVQMARRIRKKRLSIWRNHGFDILLTHAPAKGLHDQEDLCHQGFACFHTLLDLYQPAYMIHGHVHLNYGRNIPRITHYGNTQIVNASEKYVLTWPARW